MCDVKGIWTVLKMVPAASNKGVCLGTPTESTTVEKC